MSKVEEAKKFFKEIGDVYGINADEVEEVFYEILANHFDEKNILLGEDGLYVNGILYEYFDVSEIKKFTNVLQEEIQKYSILKWKIFFETYLKANRIINGVLEKEGKKNYYFIPSVNDEHKDILQKLLRIQIPKTNVKLNFAKEKGNIFKIYLPKQPEIFRKHKPIYHNKFFSPGKIITRQSVKEIIKDNIITAFSNIYSIEDFKVKYISPIKGKYGIINLVVKKQISANLLNYLNNLFDRYGYIVNAKEKK
jgi:hypothetical protein